MLKACSFTKKWTSTKAHLDDYFQIKLPSEHLTAEIQQFECLNKARNISKFNRNGTVFGCTELRWSIKCILASLPNFCKKSLTWSILLYQWSLRWDMLDKYGSIFCVNPLGLFHCWFCNCFGWFTGRKIIRPYVQGDILGFFSCMILQNYPCKLFSSLENSRQKLYIHLFKLLVIFKPWNI